MLAQLELTGVESTAKLDTICLKVKKKKKGEDEFDQANFNFFVKKKIVDILFGWAIFHYHQELFGVIHTHKKWIGVERLRKDDNGSTESNKMDCSR